MISYLASVITDASGLNVFRITCQTQTPFLWVAPRFQDQVHRVQAHVLQAAFERSPPGLRAPVLGEASDVGHITTVHLHLRDLPYPVAEARVLKEHLPLLDFHL